MSFPKLNSLPSAALEGRGVLNLWRLRDKFLFFFVYFAAKFLSQAILQNALQLSIVSSQITANDLNFCVPIKFRVPNIAILCLLILPTCAY